MTDPKDGTEVGKGGFGQFAELYRARWAARHPNAPPREAGATTSEPAASEPAASEPATPEQAAPTAPDATSK